MFDGVSSWWDGIELWLAQQWFPVQFVLVMAVLVPLCLLLAWVIRRVVDLVAALVADRGGRPRSAAPGAGRADLQ
ncbi:hypothetical protein B0I33_106340 [Prauserella shujinwangii]|uniref:Uncharacterized protein n=1 Tax=Prauserella shujinwangii TaxID=1453103 RepID=A0A2T0LU24_9PSEU|nr:hypothetical protein [Prauserella shujinwangii]PRX47239.1 hypothetical protein B0I33_106340 [Prauserella shujinwangii]